MRRSYNRRGLKKQRKLIIFCSFTLLFCLSTIYAAFSTNINLSVKGNIKDVTTVDKLKNSVVIMGDGLYKDSYEDGRYIYRGSNPNNYIKFDDSLYRIISIESDGVLKVIKNDNIGFMAFDPGYSNNILDFTSSNSLIGTRYSSSKNDYCYYSDSQTEYYGCNVWGSKVTMLDYNENNVTGMRKKIVNNSNLYDLPLNEAYLNIYLNNSWYNSLPNSIKSIIKSHIFNVGAVSDTVSDKLKDNISQEKIYKWRGKIGLIGITDYIRANSNNDDCMSLNGAESNYNVCRQTNWLNDVFLSHAWTITPSVIEVGNHYQWFVEEYKINRNQVYNEKMIYPVFYLSSDIRFKGKGTKESPFIVF